MSSYLEWNILLAVLAAELVRFHMCCLQTKWDLGGFVFACLIQTLTDGMPHKHNTERKPHSGVSHSLWRRLMKYMSVITVSQLWMEWGKG